MKICVYGAGAVGGLLAARLSSSGHAVSVIARGQTLQALSENGIGLQTGAERIYSPVKACASSAQLGVQDLIIISVKQPALHSIIGNIAPLLGSDSRVLVAMNGVPWWFFDGLEKAPADKVLTTLDPDGSLRNLIPTQQIIGCVVHLSCSVPEPGVSCLQGGNRLIIGEPYATRSEALCRIGETLEQAGFDLEITSHIQKHIWFKLWGNMTMNPISALTRATTDRILDDRLLNQFCCRIMAEAQTIGNALGLPIHETAQDRNAVTRELGAMKTSMLQDVEKGNDLEYEALIGVVHEIAEKLAIEAPDIATLYGLIRLYASHS